MKQYRTEPYILYKSEAYPFMVIYKATYLGVNDYVRNDNMVQWLTDQNIKCHREQCSKFFYYTFTNDEDATMFILRYS